MKWIYILGGALAGYLTVVHNYKYFDGSYQTGDVISAVIGYFIGAALVTVGIPAIILAFSGRSMK